MSLDVQITKKLRHFKLRVDFSCNERELLAIVGPSGAGKTIIMRTIAGLEKPDNAYIAYGDTVWTNTKGGISIPVQKRGIGYVFQEFTLFPNLNVYKNVTFAAHDASRVKELMKLLDIGHLKDSRPHKLSGGERQRCAICQALAREPRVLLMDEPFSALDTLTRKKLGGMVKSLKRELGIPILYVTHDIHEAQYLADEIMPVVNGTIDNKWLRQFMLRSKGNLHYEYQNTGYREGEDMELPALLRV